MRRTSQAWQAGPQLPMIVTRAGQMRRMANPELGRRTLVGRIELPIRPVPRGVAARAKPSLGNESDQIRRLLRLDRHIAAPATERRMHCRGGACAQAAASAAVSLEHGRAPPLPTSRTSAEASPLGLSQCTASLCHSARPRSSRCLRHTLHRDHGILLPALLADGKLCEPSDSWRRAGT